MRKSYWSVAWAVLSSLLISPSARAQDSGGGWLTFTGRVVDVNAKPIPGVPVSLNRDDPSTGIPVASPLTTATTDGAGEFTLRVPAAAVPSGRVSIVFPQPGPSSGLWNLMPEDGQGGAFYLMIPDACSPIGTPVGRCRDLWEAFINCSAPADAPPGWKLPNICDPSWPPSPPGSLPLLPPGLTPNWFHLSEDPNGFAGPRNAPTVGQSSGSRAGPFDPAGGGQPR